MARVLGRELALEEVRPVCERCFRRVFGYGG
jgi:hypothetical protein